MSALPASPADRRDERTHLFLVASLSGAGISNTVRVRNLSPSGALIEGAALPSVGSAIVLRRGSLEAAGTVVWSGAGRAGLAFVTPLVVAGWLPTREAKGPVALTRLSPSEAVGDLERLQSELVAFGETLARDPSVVANHPEIQFFDHAGQRLFKIIEALRRARL